MEEDYTICLFDLELKKVGCVLLQAVMGGDSSIPQRIDTKHWLLHPTDDMKLYKIPNDKIKEIIKRFNEL